VGRDRAGQREICGQGEREGEREREKERGRERERERERARERFVVGVSAGERDVARMSLDVVGVTAE